MSKSASPDAPGVSETSSVSADLTLGKLLEGVAEQLQAGERVDVEQLVGQHPQYEVRLRKLLPTMQAMGQLVAAEDALEVLPASDASDTGQGRFLGEFRIIREIGRGGMGVVYEAEQQSLGRRVALKVLPFAAVLDTRQLARFKNEAHAAALLQHQHIVPVHSVGCERGVHYYAMQYIKGRTLVELIAQLRQLREDEQAQQSGETTRAGTLDTDHRAPQASRTSSRPAGAAEERAPNSRSECQELQIQHISTSAQWQSVAFCRAVARLGIEAAEALDHAHDNGVVHRDIKPGNLLVDRNGHLWITDFGLARIGTDAGLTQTGDVLGTLRYMSPEQVRGHTVDERADIYSLGATLYELLTLQPAFTAHDRAELLRQVATKEPRRPRKIVPAIARDLETIVLKAIEKQADDRYDSARELADDLQQFLDEKPIQAKRSPLPRRVLKWAYRNRVLVTTATVTLLVTLACSSAVLWRAWAASEQNRLRAEANLEIVTGMVAELAQHGHDHRDVDTLRDAIAIQERVVDSISDKTTAAEILTHAMHGHGHLAQVLLDEGHVDEARKAAADYWQCLDRHDNLADSLDAYSLSRAELVNFAMSLIPMEDWRGAERAVRRVMPLTHKLFQQPRSAADRYRAAGQLADQLTYLIGKIKTHTADRASLVREYAASADAARHWLRKQGPPGEDYKQQKLIANVQAYLAHVEWLQGNVDEATALYRKAFRSLPPGAALPRPLWVSVLYEMDGLLRSQGRHRDSVGLLIEAAKQNRICYEVDPADDRFFENLVIALKEVYGTGNPDESRQACAELLQVLRTERARDTGFATREGSRFLILLMQLQVMGPYTELHDYAEALECAECFLQLDPEEQEAWLMMGLAKYRLQDYVGARQWLQKLNDEPDIDDIPPEHLLPTRMSLALTLQRLGQNETAVEYYKRGLAAFQRIEEPRLRQRAILEEAKRELSNVLLKK